MLAAQGGIQRGRLRPLHGGALGCGASRGNARFPHGLEPC